MGPFGPGRPFGYQSGPKVLTGPGCLTRPDGPGWETETKAGSQLGQIGLSVVVMVLLGQP